MTLTAESFVRRLLLPVAFRLAILLSVSRQAFSALCDPTVCGSLVPPDPSAQKYVCDASCAGLSVRDSLSSSSAGCDPVTLCRLVETAAGERSIRLVRLDHYLHSLARLSEEPAIQSSAQVLEAFRPVVEGFFADNATYGISSVGEFVGYDAQIEYLTTTQPASNFQQFRFVRSRAVPETVMWESDNVLLLDWEVTAIPVGQEKIFRGVQPTRLEYEPGSDLVKSGSVQLDFLNFVIPMALRINSSDNQALCRLFYDVCDAKGYTTGFSFGSGGEDVSGCVSELRRLNLKYYAGLPLRLALSPFRGGRPQSLSENNAICRSVHVILAQVNPEDHCPHVAKESTYCINE
jgi:hypothetical protein